MAIRAESNASAVWSGSLTEGSGTVKLQSGVVPELPVSWNSRTKRDGPHTSPEELIAGAHAACFCMALSNGLNQKGSPPRQLEVTAKCTFVVDNGASIQSMDLTVVGDVPGMDEATFVEAANAAKAGCPVSKALANNVAISVTASLR